MWGIVFHSLLNYSARHGSTAPSFLINENNDHRHAAVSNGTCDAECHLVFSCSSAGGNTDFPVSDREPLISLLAGVMQVVQN